MKAFTKTRIVIGALAVMTTMGFSSAAFAEGGPHTVKITSTPPSDGDVGGTYAVTATGNTTGNPVVLGVRKGSSSVCTITPTTAGAATVTFVGPGTCVIYAYQPGNEGGHDVQVVSGIDNDKYAPEHGHGFHGRKHGGHLLGFRHDSDNNGGGQGPKGGNDSKGGTGLTSFSSHSAVLASASLPPGSGIQSSSGTGITPLVGAASAVLAFSGMFVLMGRRRRSRTASRQ